MNRYHVWTRLLSMLLALTLCFCLVSAGSLGVWAEETDEENIVQQNEEVDEDDLDDGAKSDNVEEDDDEDEDDPEPSSDPDEVDEDDLEGDPDDDVVEADPVHSHKFKYTVSNSGDTLTAACSVDGCSLKNGKISVTLVASDKVYDGKNAAATVENKDDFKKETGASIGSISYTEAGMGTVGNTAKAGAYEASVKISAGKSNVTLTKQFNVTKRTLTVSGVSVAEKDYDGTVDAQLDLKKIKLENLVNGDDVTVEAGKAEFPSADVGVYTVVVKDVSLKGYDASNYQLKSTDKIECEFVEIHRRDITGAKVTLGPTLFTNGKEQKQTVESVVLENEEDGTSLEVTCNVMDNTAKDVGEYTLTINGIGNFTGTIKEKFLVLPSVDGVEGNEIRFGNGSAVLKMEDNNLGVTLEGSLRNILKSLSADRLCEIAAGQNVVWTLRVMPMSPTDNLKTSFARAAGTSYTVDSQYIDISLTETVDGVSTQLARTPFELYLNLDIPDRLSRARAIRLVCGDEEGNSQAIDVRLTSDRKQIRFSTNRFAAFALATEGKLSSSNGKIIFLVIVLVLLALVALGIFLYILYVRRMDERYETRGAVTEDSEEMELPEIPGMVTVTEFFTDLKAAMQEKFGKQKKPANHHDSTAAKYAKETQYPRNAENLKPQEPTVVLKPEEIRQEQEYDLDQDLAEIMKLLDESDSKQNG